MSKKKACFLHIFAVERGKDMLSGDIGDKPTYDAPDSPEERNLNVIHVCPPGLVFWTVALITSVETNVCELIPKSHIGLCGKVYPLGGSHGLQEHSSWLPIWIYFVSGAIL